MGPYRVDSYAITGAASSESVAHHVKDGMEDAVKDFEDAIGRFGEKTRKSNFARTLEEVEFAKLRLEGYKNILQEKYQGLVERTNALSAKLIKTMESWDGVEVDDACDGDEDGEDGSSPRDNDNDAGAA
jgi:hypothetical protein